MPLIHFGQKQSQWKKQKQNPSQPLGPQLHERLKCTIFLYRVCWERTFCDTPGAPLLWGAPDRNTKTWPTVGECCRVVCRRVSNPHGPGMGVIVLMCESAYPYPSPRPTELCPAPLPARLPVPGRLGLARDWPPEAWLPCLPPSSGGEGLAWGPQPVACVERQRRLLQKPSPLLKAAQGHSVTSSWSSSDFLLV